MISRDDVLSKAVNDCFEELYTLVVPKVTWEEFKEECKIYSNKYKAWENYNKAFKEKENKPEIWIQYECTFRDWENKSIEECIGPKPFEFYYLPEEIINDIVNSYVHTYRLDQQQELLNTIEILKNYCKNPIVDKYIKKEGEPGYRGYDNPDNLEKVINNYLDLEFPLMDPEMASDANDFDNKLEKAAKELQNKLFEFLDMAGKFYDWNRDLNSFNTSVYLGPSPCSNKEAVIENWKNYRNQDIEINEEQIKKDYYGEDELD